MHISCTYVLIFIYIESKLLLTSKKKKKRGLMRLKSLPSDNMSI